MIQHCARDCTTCERWNPGLHLLVAPVDANGLADLNAHEVVVSHAGLLACDCMLSGRAGLCDFNCFRSELGKLLSGRWKRFCDFVRQQRAVGELLSPLNSIC